MAQDDRVCNSCGGALNEDSKFCPACGKNVESSSDVDCPSCGEKNVECMRIGWGHTAGISLSKFM